MPITFYVPSHYEFYLFYQQNIMVTCQLQKALNNGHAIPFKFIFRFIDGRRSESNVTEKGLDKQKRMSNFVVGFEKNQKLT